MTAPVALLVGFGEQDAPLPDDVEATVLRARDMAHAVSCVEESRPQLVVVSAASDERTEGGALATLRRELPSFRAAVLVVGARAMTVSSYDPTSRRHRSQRQPLTLRDRQIRRLLAADARAHALKRIGFNDTVGDPNGTPLHVQTEVVGGGELQVRSTVTAGGKVVHATTRPLSPDLHDALGEIIAREQHDRTVAAAREGKCG